MIPEEKSISRKKAVNALHQAGGDHEKAAQLLGCTIERLKEKIANAKKSYR